MLNDSDRYYGAVLKFVIEQRVGGQLIKRISGTSAGFYLIGRNLPVYIKYSTSRRGPWQFTFQKSHLNIQQRLYNQFGECITAFVCAKDGIAALGYVHFGGILDGDFDEQESITIRRRHREMYRISGRNGVYERKVARNSLAQLI